MVWGFAAHGDKLVDPRTCESTNPCLLALMDALPEDVLVLSWTVFTFEIGSTRCYHRLRSLKTPLSNVPAWLVSCDYLNSIVCVADDTLLIARTRNVATACSTFSMFGRLMSQHLQVQSAYLRHSRPITCFTATFFTQLPNSLQDEWGSSYQRAPAEYCK